MVFPKPREDITPEDLSPTPRGVLTPSRLKRDDKCQLVLLVAKSPNQFEILTALGNSHRNKIKMKIFFILVSVVIKISL